MLKGIDSKLNAEVLFALRAMGHGDTIAIVDTNFPADQTSRSTTIGKLLQMDNLSASEAIDSILSVLPLDDFTNDSAMRMEVVDEANTIPEVQSDVQKVIDKHDDGNRRLLGIERFKFYELARQSFAVVQTGERRFYGCFILRKGVIPPESGNA